MEILKFSHPSLFTVCEPVTVFGDELKVILDGMWDAMTNRNGIGLAANQVGVHLRMFVMLTPEKEKLYLVNPVIKSRSATVANLKEGCLSAPGEFLVLGERANSVEVTFQNELGDQQTRTFSGIHSVCVQHEIDHLNGKTHLQSMSLTRQVRRALAKKWNLK